MMSAAGVRKIEIVYKNLLTTVRKRFIIGNKKKKREASHHTRLLFFQHIWENVYGFKAR